MQDPSNKDLLHHGRRTSTQAAKDLRLGRGQAGRDALAWAACRLLARLQQAAHSADELAHSVDASAHAVPTTPGGVIDTAAKVLRLAPQTWCTSRKPGK